MSERLIFLPDEGDIVRHDPGQVDWQPYADIHRERIRAHHKHDGNGDSMERKPYDDPRWLSVLVEEVGEVARALCEHRHRGPKADPLLLRRELRSELVQVAAMTAAWIDAVDLTVSDPRPAGEGVLLAPGEQYNEFSPPEIRAYPVGDASDPRS